MGHGHHHNELSGKKLAIATILNFSITVFQIIGGLISNSLSLLSDAVHNLGDGIAILVAYIANKISKKESDYKKTFGYKRVEILAALFNACTLIIISVVLFIEAYKRFLNPEPIKGWIMFSVATFGLIANIIAVLVLKKDSKKNINIKAAYIHLLGDTLSSVAVIGGGIAIIFFKIYWIDPLITVLVGIYIIWHTLSVLKKAVNILMQASPQEIDIAEIKKEIEKFELIDNIHHLHIWNLNDTNVHFECHVDLCNDIKISETNNLNKKISILLHDNFNIEHVTLQFEFKSCSNKELIRS